MISSAAQTAQHIDINATAPPIAPETAVKMSAAQPKHAVKVLHFGGFVPADKALNGRTRPRLKAMNIARA
ncbi:hypothetical protein QJS04_geneDACA023453 [Acorus gramineus]|uniref:Uncharacterized protein n=1 Tax=Acorus gramineus TaxID=55184 RepID=A0AAV9AAU7_ACOGR|nr:hypothetical protein QJS04_geneDACA023453 [Acorus gramineus]